MTRFVAVALLAVVLVSSAVADECAFTKAMKESVALHAQIRELHVAGQDYSALLDELGTKQELVVNVCMAELKKMKTHHPDAFVACCKASAELPVEGGRCELDFITSGLDIMAFYGALQSLKDQTTHLLLNSETPEQQAFLQAYIENFKKYIQVAKALFDEFFGCGG